MTIKKTFLPVLILSLVVNTAAVFGVTSKIVRFNSAAELLKGQSDDVIVDSEGTIRLARQSEHYALPYTGTEVWTVNTILSSPDGSVYMGTSPNGDIFRFDGTAIKRIYPPAAVSADDEKNEDVLLNRHVFSMTLDNQGRVLAAVSGEKPEIIRLEKAAYETVYGQDELMYIFDMAADEDGAIYLASGPEGIIYQFDESYAKLKMIYNTPDDNLLSILIGYDGFLYAGSDKRGLIYKVNPDAGMGSVVYDSEQEEITALVFDDEKNLYAAATSVRALESQSGAMSITSGSPGGRPEQADQVPPEEGPDGSDRTNIPNTDSADSQQRGSQAPPPQRGQMPPSACHIYKIDKRGFVTEVFSEMALFFDMEFYNGKLILATGNNAETFSIDPTSETRFILYRDKIATQITAAASAEDVLYLGTSNPPKMITLSGKFNEIGTYTSDLVDAGQPAMWGKIQLDAEIPEGCSIYVSSRSSNVKDPNDPVFSPWSKPVLFEQPVRLTCPLGRFCQYKLTLESENPDATPVIREVAVAHVVPNLAPVVESVETQRAKDKPDKPAGTVNINFTASDHNEDKLIYKIEFRKIPAQNWIKLAEDVDKNTYEWFTKTVEDGRYEVRVTADDRMENSLFDSLTGSRVSNPFVIDNSPPEMSEPEIKVNGSMLSMQFTVTDELSAIGSVHYTIDSNEEWISTLPVDMIYDTASEDIHIIAEDIEPGEHVIAVKLSDHIDNTAYRSFIFTVE